MNLSSRQQIFFKFEKIQVPKKKIEHYIEKKVFENIFKYI